jgi:hypothetical protein
VTDAALLEEIAEAGSMPAFLHAIRWGIDFDAIWWRLRHDERFAMEMRVCKEWRIPHSEFLGWGIEDQKKALGHFFYEALRCSQCGIHPTDWPNPDEPTFEATALFCPGCHELERFNRWAKQQAEDSHSQDALDGQKPYLKRTDA